MTWLSRGNFLFLRTHEVSQELADAVQRRVIPLPEGFDDVGLQQVVDLVHPHTGWPTHNVGPMLHGANSSSPTSPSSLFVFLPLATARISSKICWPTTSTG